MEFTYRLSNAEDPEGRLEDAAMFKALSDVARDHGDTLTVTNDINATFGATGRVFGHETSLKYWEDPAFLETCGREFAAVPYADAQAEVSKLHDRGLDAFVKSGIDKYFAEPVFIGQTLANVVGSLAYTLCDSPMPVMVQERVHFTFESRFFVVNRDIVTCSPVAHTLTPLDCFHMRQGYAWETPYDLEPTEFPYIGELFGMAWDVARTMRRPTAVVDIGMINDSPAVIEFNPLRAGRIGLYACNVRALAEALYTEHRNTVS